ncbi:hypothetical protein [Paenibacillus sp. R14(2021)]|uniref:hypothetical protein n=1 Tax=Paenibacillus sp. R14(2021) TaxID=2859228 RepID=UPI002157C223|nr:hypothetical protein [Paenibacillus sp. R14(2021)]
MQFVDPPHLEMTFGISTAQFRAGSQPTADQIAAAAAKIEEGEIMLDTEVAKPIIKTWLSPACFSAKDQKQKDYIHSLTS